MESYLRISVHCANPDCVATYAPAEFVGEYLVDDAVRAAGWSYGSVIVHSAREDYLSETAPILACSERCLGIVKALLAPIEFPDVEWIAPCRAGAS